MKLKIFLILWGIVAVSLMAETALAAKPECAGIEDKSRGEQFKLKRLHGCKVPEVSFSTSGQSVSRQKRTGKTGCRDGERDGGLICRQGIWWRKSVVGTPDYEDLPIRDRYGTVLAGARRGRDYVERSGSSFERIVRNTNLVIKGKKVPDPTWQKWLAGDKNQRASAILRAACYGTSRHLRQALDAAGRMGIRWSTSWDNPTKPSHREGALHCAAWLGNFDKVKMLIKHGFYPGYQAKDSKGGSGKTAKDLAPNTPEGKKIVGFLNEAEHIWDLPKNEREARINLLVLEYDRAAPAPEHEEKKAEKIPTLAEMLEEIKKLEGQ